MIAHQPSADTLKGCSFLPRLHLLSSGIATMAFRLYLFFCAIGGLFTGTWAFTLSRDYDCPPGWTRLNSRCLLFQNERLTFILAETVCNILGGNLVSIHNALENEIVRHLIMAETGSFTNSWIGLQDKIEDGEYVWTDGTPFDFDDWANNRPRVDTNDDCVLINFQGQFWSDAGCNGRRRFVCAKRLKHY